MCGVLFVSTMGYAKSNPMPFSSCVDEIYANAGARTMNDAKITCRMQNDAAFVQCATDLYNDLDRGYSSDRAIGICLDRYPGQSIHTSCVTILGSAGFERMAAIHICDETTDTLSLAIPKCIYRLSRTNSDTIVDDCRQAFERGQLNNEGFDKDAYARLEKENARRKAQEAADRREAQARAQAERQRQIEIAQRREAQRAADQARAAEARRQEQQNRQQEIQRQKDRAANQRIENERARRAEEKRRQEEERNFNDMIREENARQARERAKQAQNQNKKREEIPAVTPKKDVGSKNTKKSEDKPVVKQDQAKDSGSDQSRRDEEIKRKTAEGRERVERAKREAEERRQQQERDKNKGQSAKVEEKKTGDGTEDVPPPPVGGDFTDLPNPTAN
ncbi:hypothetical protein AZI86_02515 [Bdellovibrio bacteriovorus]|uniref:Uncharacterized protein n=2 Tax=Bdellovibrio bacteriovorus TaxID=959 RepID=A0A150WNH3_BDEBC|nr:hypothetical protein AZI86_02515 [Bdellovibrio bacteriovorus]